MAVLTPEERGLRGLQPCRHHLHPPDWDAVTAALAGDTGLPPPTHVTPFLWVPGSWEPTVVSVACGGGVCSLVVVVMAVVVLLAGWLVTLLVAQGVGLLATTPRTVRPAVVLAG